MNDSRLALLGRSVEQIVLALYGILLFSVFVTSLALVPITIGIPLTLGCLAPLRSLADLYRRRAAARLGRPVPSPYRVVPRGDVRRQIVTVVTDPATWRDLAWLLANATAGVLLLTLPLALFLGGFLYLGYPLLWSVTPPQVFATPFGFFTVDTLAKSCAMMPLGVVAFGLWASTQRPLTTAAARLAEALLAPRGDQPPALQLPALPGGEPSDPRAVAVRAGTCGGKV